MKILLIYNSKNKFSKKIENFVKKNFQKPKIIDHDDFKNNMKNNYDIVFSYLSKKILKKKFLKKTKFYNINFHPGCSKYPGIGCFNFALLNNESSYGVTAHLINENIDSGQIIKERRFKIDKKFNVEKLSNKSYFELFKLFKQVVIAVKNKKIKFSKIKWKRKAYTRKDLEKIAEIKINIKKDKLLEIIRCLYLSGKPGPYLKFMGLKFRYQGEKI